MQMKQSGFTLVELAVVVFLVGLLASVGLSALNAQMTSASISATKKKQEIIKDALIAYLGTNKRLPCPAIDNTGQESRVIANTPADCTHTGAVTMGYFGILPYATLGLSKSTALDGQENFFSYAVSQQWTLTYGTAPVAGGTSTNAAGSAFNVGISGSFIVNDRSSVTPYTTTQISSNAAAFIVSHGKTGLGALTSKGTQNVPPASGTDELANVPVSTTWLAPAAFYQRGYTENPTGAFGAFDDVVLTLNPSDLIIPLVKDGAFKSANSQWADQIDNIKNAVIGFIFSPNNVASCAPPTSAQFATLLTAIGIPNQTPPTTFADPWGYQVTYINTGITTIHSYGSGTNGAGSSVPSIYTLQTVNPNITTIPTQTNLAGAYPTLLANCPP